MKKIAAGKAFYMQSKHVKVNYRLLTQIRSSPGAFADLPHSMSDAAQFYQAEDGSSTEKVFWSQYAEAGHPVPVSDQMKQMVKGTLTQMEQPEAQSYFANDPQFPARLETIRRAAELIDYLDVDVPAEELAPAENPQPAN